MLPPLQRDKTQRGSGPSIRDDTFDQNWLLNFSLKSDQSMPRRAPETIQNRPANRTDGQSFNELMAFGAKFISVRPAGAECIMTADDGLGEIFAELKRAPAGHVQLA